MPFFIILNQCVFYIFFWTSFVVTFTESREHDSINRTFSIYQNHLANLNRRKKGLRDVNMLSWGPYKIKRVNSNKIKQTLILSYYETWQKDVDVGGVSISILVEKERKIRLKLKGFTQSVAESVILFEGIQTKQTYILDSPPPLTFLPCPTKKKIWEIKGEGPSICSISLVLLPPPTFLHFYFNILFFNLFFLPAGAWRENL